MGSHSLLQINDKKKNNNKKKNSKIESTDQFAQLFVHVGNGPAMVELEHGTVNCKHLNIKKGEKRKKEGSKWSGGKKDKEGRKQTSWLYGVGGSSIFM